MIGSAKAYLKTQAPGLYGRLMQVRTSEPVRALHATRGLHRWSAARLAGRTMGFDISGKMGMGSMMTHMLLLLRHFDAAGMRPALRLSNALYAPGDTGDDYIDRYFVVEGNRGADPALAVIDVKSGWDYRILGIRETIGLTEAQELFRRSVQIHPAILAEVERVAAEAAIDGATLGVHFRGTDKRIEAPAVDAEQALRAVAAARDRHRCQRVFLATDEPQFAARLRASFPAMAIAIYERPEVPRSLGAPRHLAVGGGYWKGVEALVNMALLARCGALVRTASHLSGWAKVLNPRQPVIMLNRPYGRFAKFPDSEISRPPASTCEAPMRLAEDAKP